MSNKGILTGATLRRGLLVLTISVLVMGCQGRSSRTILASNESPIHLEEFVSRAAIVGSDVPKGLAEAVEWRFNEPQPGWKPIVPLRPPKRPAPILRTEDSLRLALDESVKWTRSNTTYYSGGIFTNVPDWQREDWAFIIVTARVTSEGGGPGMVCSLNMREASDPKNESASLFLVSTESVRVVPDGKVHAYAVRADWSPGEYSGQAKWQNPWRQLGLQFGGNSPAAIDILSVHVVPKEANYAGRSVGVSTEVRGISYRRALFTHSPGGITYNLRIAKGGRLDVGLGVLRDDAPVTFRVKAEVEGGLVATLHEERYADKTAWAQRSIDLEPYAGRKVDLTLESESERPGAVALWAAPTVSGARPGRLPNVILYVIDGAAADQMSIYGYNRRTTPQLERLVPEGIVFERAYSNSSWTKISVPSFMTSLHSSVLGPYKTPSDRIPQNAVTMAERLHGAGYQTAVFVSNPHCGTMSGLDRGVDVLREAGVTPNSRSSEELQADFWRWRREYPGGPYWAHIQTTDVHIPWTQSAPFAGLFVDPDLQKTYGEWLGKIGRADGSLPERFKKAGVDPVRFYFVARGLYDETMAHQDDQIGRFVRQLKAEGEWENTIFIVTADHSSSAAGLMLTDPLPATPDTIRLASYVTHIPLMLFWPAKVKSGGRSAEGVSLIDLLPTILDLTGLPEQVPVQGRSFAPLLVGKSGWESRPVILDEFNDWRDDGEIHGTIDVIDGRWGASLKIGKAPWEEKEKPENLRPAALLVFDLWSDPLCLQSLHAERPDLVKKYSDLLENTWRAHRALGKEFRRVSEAPLNSEQLETLRTLGYIR